MKLKSSLSLLLLSLLYGGPKSKPGCHLSFN